MFSLMHRNCGKIPLEIRKKLRNVEHTHLISKKGTETLKCKINSVGRFCESRCKILREWT